MGIIPGEIDSEKDVEGEQEQCKACKNGVFVVDEYRGEKVCSACGLVLKSKIIDPGPEWRAFDANQQRIRTRVGAPLTYAIHDRGLNTTIDLRDQDAFGHEISSRAKAQVYRLRKWQRRIRISDTIERNLSFALSELDRMASALSLPRNLQEMGARIYRVALKNHLLKGRSIEGVVAACIYVSCRLCKVSRTLQEIAEVARVGKKEIGHCYRFISDHLTLNAGPTSPAEYIARFASGLKLSAKCQETARHILKMASEKGLISGRCPTGLAAAALYLACVLEKERRSQRNVASIAGVTEVTVRNRSKELMSRLEIEVTDEC